MTAASGAPSLAGLGRPWWGGGFALFGDFYVWMNQFLGSFSDCSITNNTNNIKSSKRFFLIQN